MSIARQQAGAKAQAEGQRWEQENDLLARAAGILVVPQYPEVRRNRRGYYVPKDGDRQADRWMFYNGRPWLLDYKTTGNKNAFTVPHDHNGLLQFHSLVNAADAGIPAFYCIEWRLAGSVELFAVNNITPWPLKLQICGGTYLYRSDWGNHWLYFRDKIAMKLQ